MITNLRKTWLSVFQMSYVQQSRLRRTYKITERCDFMTPLGGMVFDGSFYCLAICDTGMLFAAVLQGVRTVSLIWIRHKTVMNKRAGLRLSTIYRVNVWLHKGDGHRKLKARLIGSIRSPSFSELISSGRGISLFEFLVISYDQGWLGQYIPRVLILAALNWLFGGRGGNLQPVYTDNFRRSNPIPFKTGMTVYFLDLLHAKLKKNFQK